jgi:hypothetical protein
MCERHTIRKHMLKSHIQFALYFLSCVGEKKQQKHNTHRFHDNYRGLMVRIVKKVVILYAKTLLNS